MTPLQSEGILKETFGIDGPIVLVTGGTGFVGKHVVALLQKRGYQVYDHGPNLLNRDATRRWFETHHIDHCIHLAANTGGIQYNRLHPDEIFYDNAMMGLNLLRELSLHSDATCLSVTTSCTMPDLLDGYTEDLFHSGPPNSSVQFFAYAKRNLEIYSRALNQQHGNQFKTVCVTNLFGPGDSADLDKTKVVGALIVKMLKAQKDGSDLTLWGTGKPLRDFLYVKDAARYIIESLFWYDDYSMPLNIGSGTEISIRELAEKIKDLVGFGGEIKWDVEKPDGQYRKMLNVDRMAAWLNVSNTEFDVALKETIEYYRGLQNV